MQLDDELKQFLAAPRMIIVGTADRQRRPAIARAMGAYLPDREGRIELVISDWQWPETIANIRETGRIAATFASVSDYVSYQIKGEASLREATPEDIARSASFIQNMGAELRGLGVPDPVTQSWLTNRDPIVAVLDVREIYVQTPGPKAGMTVGGA